MKLSINEKNLMPYVKVIIFLMVLTGIIFSFIDKNNTDIVFGVLFGLLLLQSFDIDDLKEEIKELKDDKNV